MKKRLLSILMVLALLVVTLTIQALAADDHYNLSNEEAIAQVNASGRMNDALKARFLSVLVEYQPNTEGFEKGKTYSISEKGWSAQNCAYLALYAYYNLTDYYYGRDGAADSYLLMQNATCVSYNDFVSNNIMPGAHIRTGTSYSGNNGHSMILLDYNEEYIYVYQANRYWSGGGVGIRVTRYSWDGFNSEEIARHTKINHISMPKDYDQRWKAAGLSTLAISPTQFPSDDSGALPLGKPFYFRGSITSNYAITSATVQILNREGGVAQEKTVYPNKASVDFLKDGLDSLKFGQLGEGFYTMRLTASDSSSRSVEWSSAFTVGNPAPPSAEPFPEPSPESSQAPEKPEPPVKESKLPFAMVNSWSASQFDDVSASDWYYQNVKLAYRLNLMKGTHAEAFSPGSKMTVAEAVTMAVRIHAAYYGAEDEIPAYDGGNWYDGYVDYALDNGIPIHGMRMDGDATRDQFVYILTAALPEDELTAMMPQLDFADRDDITHTDAVYLLSRAGVINGVTWHMRSYFEPDNAITRAEAAAVITRMVIPAERVIQ